jgi:methylase of polypeptide subunit release factors
MFRPQFYFQVIEAKVLQISRCRSKGFISLVDIRVTFDESPMGVISDKRKHNGNSFMCSSDSKNIDRVVGEDYDKDEVDNCDQRRVSASVEPDSEHSASMAPTPFTAEKVKCPKSAADYRYLHYPTLRLRSIKRALSLCGHQIVGDGGAVKSAKGIFAAVVSVTIHCSDDDEYISSDTNALPTGEEVACKSCRDATTLSCAPFTVSVDDPKKFAKLMFKEQEMWDFAEARDRELLRAWGTQCTERNVDQNTMKEPRIMDKQALASSKDKPLLPVEEQSDRISSKRSNHVSINTSIASLTTAKSSKSYSSLADMRNALASGMPVEYVLGEASFCGLRYMVNPAVMVPRKSSEVLVHEALRVISYDILLKMSAPGGVELETTKVNRNLDISSPLAQQVIQQDPGPFKEVKTLKLLDIGTGSGCLLLSCMKIIMEHQKGEFEVQGLGIDLSPEALQVASENSIALGLEQKTDFKVLDFGDLSALVLGPRGPLLGSNLHEADINSQLVTEMSHDQKRIKEEECWISNTPIEIPAEGLHHDHDILPCMTQGPFHVILCNPPYSSRRDTTRLSVACREHEPSLALFASDGPLAAYRVLASSLTAAEEKRVQNIHSMRNRGSVEENVIGSEEEGLFSRNGHLFLEVGHGQHLPVQKIFSKLPFLSFVRGAKDHKGIDRCLVYQYCGDKISNLDFYHGPGLLL